MDRPSASEYELQGVQRFADCFLNFESSDPFFVRVLFSEAWHTILEMRSYDQPVHEPPLRSFFPAASHTGRGAGILRQNVETTGPESGPGGASGQDARGPELR
jgi:hypothetical protein